MRRARWAALFLLALATDARAGAEIAAMAGAGGLRAGGMAGVARNPAAAAFVRGLDLAFLDLDLCVGNDSYSVSDYERWNGAFWTDVEKREIVSSVSGRGLDAYGHAQGSIGAAGPGWAAGFRAVGAGQAGLPRDILELALFGNHPGRAYDLDGARGDASAMGELRLTHGALVRWTHPHRELAVGGTFRLIHGWATAEVQEARGSLTTTPEVLNADVVLVSRTATGGDGFGLDLGAILQWDSGLRLGLSLENAPAIVWWDRDTKRQENRAIADSLTLDQGEDSDLFQSDTKTRSIAPFARSLPVVLHAAAGRPWNSAWVEVAIDQGCGRAAEINRTPRIALGAAWPARPSQVQARAGAAAGGLEGTLLAAGVGASLNRVRLDLALQSLGGPLRGRGIGAALALHISSTR